MSELEVYSIIQGRPFKRLSRSSLFSTILKFIGLAGLLAPATQQETIPLFLLFKLNGFPNCAFAATDLQE